MSLHAHGDRAEPVTKKTRFDVISRSQAYPKYLKLPLELGRILEESERMVPEWHNSSWIKERRMLQRII